MTTTKIENAIMGDIKKDGSTVKVIFDRSMGKEVHLIIGFLISGKQASPMM